MKDVGALDGNALFERDFQDGLKVLGNGTGCSERTASIATSRRNKVDHHDSNRMNLCQVSLSPRSFGERHCMMRIRARIRFKVARKGVSMKLFAPPRDPSTARVVKGFRWVFGLGRVGNIPVLAWGIKLPRP